MWVSYDVTKLLKYTSTISIWNFKIVTYIFILKIYVCLSLILVYLRIGIIITGNIFLNYIILNWIKNKFINHVNKKKKIIMQTTRIIVII